VSGILVDIDSTTFDTHGLSIQLMNEHFGTSYTSADVDDWSNPKNIAVEHSIWRWSDECFGNPDFNRRLSPKEDAVRVIEHLFLQNYDITFVTDRPLSMLKTTRELLDRHGFQKFPMLFTEGTDYSKIEIAKLFMMSIFVEDSPRHARQAAKSAFIDRVFLFDYAYNRDVGGDKVQRVTTWKEIEEVLCA